MGISCVCCGLFYSQVFLHLKSPNNPPKESTATAPLCFRHYSHSSRAGVPNRCVGGVSSVAGALVFAPKKGLESLLSIQRGASVGRRSPANGKPKRHILLRSLFKRGGGGKTPTARMRDKNEGDLANWAGGGHTS